MALTSFITLKSKQPESSIFCVWYLSLAFFGAFSLLSVQGQEKDVVSLGSGSWKLAPQAEVTQTGEQISTAGFPTDSWLTAQVPGTVFGSYVLAGKEQDPNYGDNIYHVDLSKYDRNFWYRTDFTVPENYTSRRIWLNLDGVNRDADVYVNGTQVGSAHGFMQRGRFDVTTLVKVGGENSLGVLDYVPSPNVAKKAENISSPSFICTKGWDWMPRVPGFDMGIYKDVYLSCTGDVSVIDTQKGRSRLKFSSVTGEQSGLQNSVIPFMNLKFTGPGNLQIKELEMDSRAFDFDIFAEPATKNKAVGMDFPILSPV